MAPIPRRKIEEPTRFSTTRCRAARVRSAAAAMQLQGVRGDEQDLEKDEEVEQVAGEEGAVDPQELHLEERVKVAAPAVVAGGGVEQAAQGQHGGEGQHQGAQPVHHQGDAVGCGPIAKVVDQHLAARGAREQQQRDGQQRRCCGKGTSALGTGSPPAGQEQDAPATRGISTGRMARWLTRRLPRRPGRRRDLAGPAGRAR